MIFTPLMLNTTSCYS